MDTDVSPSYLPVRCTNALPKRSSEKVQLLKGTCYGALSPDTFMSRKDHARYCADRNISIRRTNLERHKNRENEIGDVVKIEYIGTWVDPFTIRSRGPGIIATTKLLPRTLLSWISPDCLKKYPPADPTNHFFLVHRGTNMTIDSMAILDLQKCSPWIRNINTSCEPTCIFEYIRTMKRYCLVVRKPLSPGDELTLFHHGNVTMDSIRVSRERCLCACASCCELPLVLHPELRYFQKQIPFLRSSAEAFRFYIGNLTDSGADLTWIDRYVRCIDRYVLGPQRKRILDSKTCTREMKHQYWILNQNLWVNAQRWCNVPGGVVPNWTIDLRCTMRKPLIALDHRMRVFHMTMPYLSFPDTTVLIKAMQLIRKDCYFRAFHPRTFWFKESIHATKPDGLLAWDFYVPVQSKRKLVWESINDQVTGDSYVLGDMKSFWRK